jgi:hypothetical protein
VRLSVLALFEELELALRIDRHVAVLVGMAIAFRARDGAERRGVHCDSATEENGGGIVNVSTKEERGWEKQETRESLFMAVGWPLFRSLSAAGVCAGGSHGCNREEEQIETRCVSPRAMRMGRDSGPRE